MATNAPKILTIRFDASDTESMVTMEFGSDEITQNIPTSHGVIRASAILSDDGKLVDCEIVTEKQ
jgi:hypothetical protein